MENKFLALINLKIDSKELIFDIDGTHLDSELLLVLEEIKKIIINKNVTNIFRLSILEILNTPLQLDYSRKNLVQLERFLSLLRIEIKKHWGQIPTQMINSSELIDNLICRCKALGPKELNESFSKHAGDYKKIYKDTEAAGICGSCFDEVEAYLNTLEDEEGKIFNKPIELWENEINVLIEEYYLVCPPDFSALRFKLLSINSSKIRIKCLRNGDKPGRPAIQESINNFFKGQLTVEIPISIII